MALKQRTPEWRAAKRALVTSTDIPVILGLSPYRSEGELAREKAGGEEQTPNLQMSVGQALEPLIAQEYERVTGTRLNRVHGLVTHPTITWAGASPDFRVVGARRLVEAKWTQSRRWDDEELPQDVEAQVRWAMGVTGVHEVDVAAIVHGREFRVVHVDHDDATFDGLVVIAEDFRRRMAEGGPFRETKDSVKALYPQDDGSTLLADSQEVRWVDGLLNLRRERDAIEAEIEAIEVAVKQRMADHARLEGPGWAISWKRTKDKETTDWKAVAQGLLTTIKPEEAEALVSLQTMTTPGSRPFKLTTTKEGHTL
jgi:putative phage-type endonuclease